MSKGPLSDVLYLSAYFAKNTEVSSAMLWVCTIPSNYHYDGFDKHGLILKPDKAVGNKIIRNKIVLHLLSNFCKWDFVKIL